MSNFLFRKQLNSLKTPQERLAYFQYYDNKQKTIISNLEQMTQWIHDYCPVYDKTTKDDLNYLVKKYIDHFKDYRSAILRNAKKHEYPQALINVHNRMIETANEFYIESGEILKQLEKEIENSNKRANGRIIARAIDEQKKSYVMGFDDPSEGVEAWNSLIELIEDGIVGIKELPEYGIDVPNILTSL